MSARTRPCANCADASYAGRVTRFDMDGVSHAAPDMWLAGRSIHYERSGDGPLVAYASACKDWAFGCEMAAVAASHA